MTKYLIFTYEICNLGGGQLYVQRRAKYLTEKGFDVRVVVFFHDPSYFPLENDFSGIPFYVIPEMGRTSSCLTNSKVNNIIGDLLNMLGKNDDIYIESHTLTLIEWGELVAMRCQAKHLAYPLAEPIISNYFFNPGKKIFSYKLINNQFYGCTSVSLKQIFGKTNVPSNYVNIGFKASELNERCFPQIPYDKNNSDFVISTVGRLEKQYIEPLIEACIKFSDFFPNQHIVLIIGGGSKIQGREEYLKRIYGNLNKNLEVIFTGYIERLGKDIFNMSDVFVGMGTASLNAISQGCLTINVDPNNEMKFASGFFGIDTNNFAYSESGKVFDISEKLKEAYLMNPEKRQMIILKAKTLFDIQYEENACFSKLDDVISSIEIAHNKSILHVSFCYRISVIILFSFYKFLKKTYLWQLTKLLYKK